MCGTPASWYCPAAACQKTLCMKIRSIMVYSEAKRKFVQEEWRCLKVFHSGKLYERTSRDESA